MKQELSYIYVSELKVAAFSCPVDDLVVILSIFQCLTVRSPIWT